MIERAPPPPDLSSWVEAFSARSLVARRAALPIFPSARAELVFHFGDPFLVGDDDSSDLRPLPRAAVLGPRRRLYWQRAGPRIDWLIVQMTPLGCRALLGCRFADLWSREIPLADLWGAAAAELHERLACAASFADKAAIAAAALRALARPARGDAAVSRLVGLARRGRVRNAAAMADLEGIGPRRLRQRFDEEVGLGPKHFLSLMRFGRLLASTHPRPWMSAPELGAEYADESHAIREFRRFAGTTPGAYRAAKSSGDDLVFTGAAIPLD